MPQSAGARLRSALDAGPVMLPGVFNPLVARMAERAGFKAVYLSGAALSATLALPDVGLVTLTEFVEAARAITRATSLPLISDADTGFGEALNVERTVQLFEEAGAAGIHLEDQVMPKRCGHLSGKALVEPAMMEAKIRAAVAARKDKSFFIIARTDARGVNGFADAVERANRYRAAGADAIFSEALETADEFGQFAKESPGLLLANMTEFGKSPLLDAATLAKLGYRLILFPVSSLRTALKAVEELFAEVARAGSQQAAVSKMLTRASLYDLLSYTGYEERDKSYFGK
ncbi:MAG: methylisocitrate lyase [Gemmataceae bacterium]